MSLIFGTNTNEKGSRDNGAGTCGKKHHKKLLAMWRIFIYPRHRFGTSFHEQDCVLNELANVRT